MSPHIKEYMRDTSDKTTDINRFKRISHFIREKPEKSISLKDCLGELFFQHINNKAQHDRIDCQDKEVTMPDSVSYRFSYEEKI